MKYLIILFALFLFSCSKSEENNETTGNNANNIPGAYVGVWKGTYTGVGGGKWNITVKGDGTVTGQIFSNVNTRNQEGYALGTVSKPEKLDFSR